jgi:hypothetical protein
LAEAIEAGVPVSAAVERYILVSGGGVVILGIILGIVGATAAPKA